MYNKKDCCSICGTIVVEAYTNIGYGSFCKRYLCPKCNELKKIKTECQSCKKSIKYLANGHYEKKLCHHCQQNQNKNLKHQVSITKIPSWRLKMDDATPDEVTTLPSQAFGMPTKSLNQWNEYYEQPHEVQKQKEYQKEKENLTKELLG